MNRSTAGALGAILCAASCAVTAGEIDVMTQNQYFGADLSPVFVAATSDPFDPGAFNLAVVQTLQRIAATTPALRALTLAKQIATRRPHVVGLQETFHFRCDPYPGAPVIAGTGCDDPSIKGAFRDMMADTQAALGTDYRLVGRVPNLQVPGIPFVVNGMPAILSFTDRDAILARSDVAAAPVTVPCAKPSGDGCNFVSAPPIFNTPAGPIAVERGFLAADLTVDGAAYRVFNTHLEQRLLAANEPATRVLQVGQAYELLGAAYSGNDGSRRVIVVGDFNSAPEDVIGAPYPPTLPPPFPPAPFVPPYQVMVQNGFTDVWPLFPHPPQAGATCCQAEDLRNAKSAHYERIDMIFTLGAPRQVINARLMSSSVGDKTRPPGNGGVWPSDHASLAARIRFD